MRTVYGRAACAFGVLLGVVSVSPWVLAEPEQSSAKVLTMARAVEVALELQPSLRVARGNTDAAFGRADQARVIGRPTLSLIGSAASASPDGSPCTSAWCKPVESAGIGVQATWRLTDFGQTAANVRAADLTAEATKTTTAQAALDIRLAVETAYLEAVARRQLTVVAETTVASEVGHVDQARKFVAGGAQDPISVVQAQARLANARSALAQARSSEAVSLANLRAAIGWTDPTQAITVDPTWPMRSTDPPAVTALVEQARARRPEIVQLDKLAVAADASVTAAYAERRPVLSAQAAAQWLPTTRDVQPEQSFSVGLTLSVPVFDGGRSRSDARTAKGQRTVAIANRDQLIVTLVSQLESARDQIVTNRETVRASEEAVVEARAQLQLSDARYTQGIGSQIELTDAETAVTTAEGSLVSARWQLATAWSQLDRAIGGP